MTRTSGEQAKWLLERGGFVVQAETGIAARANYRDGCVGTSTTPRGMRVIDQKLVGVKITFIFWDHLKMADLEVQTRGSHANTVGGLSRCEDPDGGLLGFIFGNFETRD